MTKQFKSGDIVPKSDTYIAYDGEGHDCGSLYLERGRLFPATPNANFYYKATSI